MTMKIVGMCHIAKNVWRNMSYVTWDLINRREEVE